MADYPTNKMKEQKIPLSAGHTGVVIDSSIEGRQAPENTSGTIGTYKTKK